ncbi:MAG: hypothetical protein LBK45_04830 [Tannerellaceae bacterium]|jgi:hypothetical protein|nr:hypothetical protein [Tannerellaceae bacterium]
MKTETLNENLIEAIKEKIPKGVNLASVLMDTLYIGKEAVYRRLRGEVPFTFTEASIISNSLGVSLDRVSGANSPKNALFALNIIDHKHPMKTYYAQIENYIRIYNAVKNNPTLEWYAASNIIPQVFYLDYDHLARFLLYKWMYQHEKINNIKYFSELKFSEGLREMQKEYVKVSKEVASANFIWDNMMFCSLVNDIRYFVDINLITRDEVEALKGEILRLIDELEQLAASGYHKPGKSIRIYVSNINFEASYGYLETDDFKLSMFRLYSINEITTADGEVFEHQKEWIHSLRKYATLISISGEMQRIQFFEKQRQYVYSL